MRDYEITVSVIIPVYNAEKYIKETINSIEHQSHIYMEIIIVNDGSTDNSYHRILEMEKYYKNIKILTQENKGAANARNIGISYASGKYIFFFDADDKMDESAIANMVQAMEENSADLVVGNYQIINENGKVIREENNEDYKGREELKFFISPYPGNKLYRKSIIDENLIRFDDVRIGQDLNFYLKYILFCKKIVYIEKRISFYRIVENSITRSYDSRILDIRKNLEYVCEFYKKNSATYEMMTYLYITCANHCQMQMTKVEYVLSQQMKKNIYYKLSAEVRKYLLSFFPHKISIWRLYFAAWKRYIFCVLSNNRF